MHSRTIQAGALLLTLVCVGRTFGQNVPGTGTAREESGADLVYGGGDASPPYEFLDPAGRPQGVNVDLVRALARVTGRSLEIRLGKWNDIRQEMEAGRIDLMSLAYTEERARSIGFLDETWTVRLAVLFPAGRSVYPESVMDLRGERVAVQEGEMTHELLMALPEASRPAILSVRDHVAAIDLMRKGQATAVAGNALVLRTALARLGVGNAHEVIVRASPYRLATSRGREAEMAWIGPALRTLRESGEFSRIVEEHLTEAPRPRSLREFAGLIAAFLVVIAAVLLGSLLWTRSLRAQVEARTRSIAEAAAEKDRLTQSLLKWEQRMRMVVEQMPAILWSTDRDLRVTSASGRGLATLGLDETRIVGETVAEIVAQLGLASSRIMECMEQGLSGRPSDLEIQIGGRDAELHIEPLRDPDGGISGLVGIVLDIAEHRRAATALRDSEERYRAFVAHSTEGIWRWEFNAPFPKGASLDEQYEYFVNHAYVAECNDAMAQLYGLKDAEALTGRMFSEVRRLRSVVSNTDNVRAFIASGFQPTEWETNWIDEKGASRWTASSVVGILKDGALIRTWSTQRDITAQKRAEEGLRHALSLVRATLDSATDGILVENTQGGIVDVNERFGAMWRVPPEMLAPTRRHVKELGRHAMDQLLDPGGFVARAHQILAQPDAESYDVLRLRDGRVFERFSRPQRLGETTVGRVWTFRDVTERERSMIEIQEANRLLEVKNAELERFTYTVSHDLKSPLITIRGYMGHLEASALAGDMAAFKEDASRINRAAAKMEDLLRDLLELSRVGRVLNPDEDVSMADVAQDAADLLRGPLLERGVKFEIEAGLPVIRGDRRRLVEVVQNLAENAIKFMGAQKDPVVRLGVRDVKGQTAFFVSDNGIGIDARHRDKVFELFEKLTPGTEGTGVGLALVKRIVEAHGGKVWVESEGSGRGSTFFFTLRSAALN